MYKDSMVVGVWDRFVRCTELHPKLIANLVGFRTVAIMHPDRMFSMMHLKKLARIILDMPNFLSFLRKLKPWCVFLVVMSIRLDQGN